MDLAPSFGSPAAIREVVRRYAVLLDRVGDELGERPLVLPNSEFFPDVFKGNEDSVRRLAARMQRHAGMRDIPIETHLVNVEAQVSNQSCSSGACAPSAVDDSLQRLEPTDNGWKLNVATAELGHPVVLTTNLSRALANVFLVETLEEGTQLEKPIEATVDLAAVALGFGCLMLEGSYLYGKSCSGPSVHSATALSTSDLAVATSLFVAIGNHKTRALIAELSTTQLAMFKQARDWLSSNPALVSALRADPSQLTGGDFSIKETQPLLTRLFRRKPRDEELFDRALAGELPGASILGSTPKRQLAAAPKDDLKSLVEEALQDANAE